MIVHDIIIGLAAKLSHISNITNTPYPLLVEYISLKQKSNNDCFVLVHVAPFRHIIYDISCFSIFFLLLRMCGDCRIVQCKAHLHVVYAESHIDSSLDPYTYYIKLNKYINLFLLRLIFFPRTNVLPGIFFCTCIYTQSYVIQL